MTISNSVLSGNTGDALLGSGGGIYNDSAGTSAPLVAITCSPDSHPRS